jgi:electron transfer flavoprotein alpha subunit
MILALAEHDAGVPTTATLESVTLARGLAAAAGEPLTAIAFGRGSAGLAADLGRYGVATLHAAEGGHDTYAPVSRGRILAGLAVGAVAVVAPASERGNEVAAHAAAIADAPMAAGVIAARPGSLPGTVEVTRLRWAGSLLEEAVLEGDGPKFLTVPAGSVPAEPAASPAEVAVAAVDADPDAPADQVRVVELFDAGSEGVSLAAARVVVGGGRGVGGTDGFGVLEELAGLLGGTVGVSRVVTSEGWRPHRDQVGQTGTRIFPELYIACGISGAIQHMVGCKGARHILAINRDPDAPIMTKADYSVVGDLHTVLPALVAEVRKAQEAAAARR